MRLLVIGDVHAPRTAALQRALALEGWPAAEVVSYAEVLRHGGIPRGLLTEDTLIRLDAPVRGEDDQVFLGCTLRPGELVPRERWFRGFRKALAMIGTANVPDVEGMCDKVDSLSFLGWAVPCPRLLGEVRSFEELRALADKTGVQRLFLKPVYGSSGAGIVAMILGRDRVQAWTTVEPAEGTLFNTRRIRVERDLSRLASLVDALCARDRMYAEQWIPKAAFDGKTVDLRVVVVAGAVERVVVRASNGPITNLHLGNERRDVESIRRHVADAVWEQAMDSAVRAAACFPSSLAAGIDLAFTSRRDRHFVLEINAFGDYVRTADDDGSGVYRRQLQVLRSRVAA
jgi:glutathione synthase/RimK-type ligase-like ATP-grasp enzyme